MIISVLRHDLYVTYGWNFMKLILNIYEGSEVMHMKFYQGVISYSGVILPFDCLNFFDSFRPQA